MRIDDLLEMAARDLPEGWSVRIEVERSAAWVKVVGPDGNEHDMESDEAELSELVRDAIEFAIAMAAVPDEGRGIPRPSPSDCSCPRCGAKVTNEITPGYHNCGFCHTYFTDSSEPATPQVEP